VTARLLILAAAVSAAASCANPCEVQGAVCRIAGSGTSGFNGNDISALKADLSLPIDVTVGPDKLVYVVDWNNHRVRRVETNGLITNVAGDGIGDNAVGEAAYKSLNHPTQVVFKGSEMFVAAWHNSKIMKVTLAASSVGESTIADYCGTGNRAYSGDNGPAIAADLDLPASVAFGPDGSLYIMDQANQVIRKVKSDDTIERVAGQCIIGTPIEGQQPFDCPTNDKLTWVPETEADRCARPCPGAFGGDGGSALQARIAQPFGQAADPAGRMAFDSNGNLFFADTSNDRIRKIDTAGIITTVVGNGTYGSESTGTDPLAVSLAHPTDIDFGPDGTMYIADTANSCVRAVKDGVISTVLGTCGQRGSAGLEGPATDALINRPYGLAIDTEGNLYVADTHNQRILRVQIAAPAEG